MVNLSSQSILILLSTNVVEMSTHPDSQWQFPGVERIGSALEPEIEVPIVGVILIHMHDYTCYLCGHLGSTYSTPV